MEDKRGSYYIVFPISKVEILLMTLFDSNPLDYHRRLWCGVNILSLTRCLILELEV